MNFNCVDITGNSSLLSYSSFIVDNSKLFILYRSQYGIKSQFAKQRINIVLQPVCYLVPSYQLGAEIRCFSLCADEEQ